MLRNECPAHLMKHVPDASRSNDDDDATDGGGCGGVVTDCGGSLVECQRCKKCVSLPACMPAYLPTYSYTYLPMYLPTHIPTYPYTYLPMLFNSIPNKQKGYVTFHFSQVTSRYLPTYIKILKRIYLLTHIPIFLPTYLCSLNSNPNNQKGYVTFHKPLI